MVHALLNGDQETGISVLEVTRDRFDVGHILFQEKMAVTMDDTCSTYVAIHGGSGETHAPLTLVCVCVCACVA